MMAFNPDQPRASDGKWGQGGAPNHQSGVNGVGKPVLAKKAVQAILSGENTSVRPNGAKPTHGYMVSVPGRTKILNGHELHQSDAEHTINDFARANADVLKDPSAHIGVWRDGGKVYLDVSHNIAGKFAAIREGRKGNQIAIYDVKHNRVINTGGSGT
jgi:hypothetical protein